jgi:hypothetical protein
MIIHTTTKKSKKRKPSAKQRELQADWETLVKKYAPKKPIAKTKDDGWTYSLGVTARRETPKIPSLPFTGGPCLKKEQQTYTGNKIKGIGTMHKSNAVPVFSDEEAVALSSMRR